MKKIFFLFIFSSVAFLSRAQTFDSLLAIGDTYYEKENYLEAIKYFSKAIKTHPGLAKGYEYRADAYRELKEHEKAIKDYSEAIKLDVKTWYFRKRGDCYLKTLQYDLAEKDFNKGIELNAEDKYLWLYRGNLYYILNKKELACSDYQKANELKETSAKEKAITLGCDWVNIKLKPCPEKAFAITKTEIDPFTGAIAMSKGIEFSELELKPDEGLGFITGPNLGEQSIQIKLKEPKNLCADEKDDVFAGIGFGLYDQDNKELAFVEDLNKDSKEGLPKDYLKSLSMTVGFTDTATLKYNKNYLLKIRFYDKRGTAEAYIHFPFIMSAKTNIQNNILTTESSLGMGISTAAIETKVEKISFIRDKTNEVDMHTKLKKDTYYKIKLENISDLSTKSKYTLRLVDEHGKIMSEEQGLSTMNKSDLLLKFSTVNLEAGTYYLWLKLDDDQSRNIGMSIYMKIE